MFFLFKLISSIGLFFTGLFNEAKKVWKKLSPELQAVMLQGSGIVNTINTYIDATPQVLLDAIKADFPALDAEKLKGSLAVVGKDLGIAQETNSDDILVVLANIQKLLLDKKTNDGTGWAKASHTAYLAIAAFLAPGGTKIAMFISLAEYVYHDLIKGGK